MECPNNTPSASSIYTFPNFQIFVTCVNSIIKYTGTDSIPSNQMFYVFIPIYDTEVTNLERKRPD